MDTEISSERSESDAAIGCTNGKVGVGVKVDYRENWSVKISGF
jgi:hypothetical protein